MELKKFSVRLETVTPMWMGGAGGQPELRPPSVRGCLRFWLRALLGGTLGDDVPTLLAAESAIFGNTQRASPLVVRIDAEPPRTGLPSLSEEEFPGARYMYWSTFQRNRDAILPGESFNLQVQGRPWDLQDVEVQGVSIGQEEAFRLCAASLWLLVRLGGMGARARRGGGTVQLSEPPSAWPAGVPSPIGRASTPQELAGELAEGVEAIRQLVPWQNGAVQSPTPFDLLHPNACEVNILDQTFSTWWEALDWTGRHFQEFRRSYRSDVGAIAELLTRGRMAAMNIQRSVLGLPIVFFIKSIFESLTDRGVPARDARRKASATVAPKRSLGRASPLTLRLVQLAGDPPKYAVIMILFRSRFLPDSEMTVRPQDRSIRPVGIKVPADHTVIEKWFDYLKAEGAALEPVAL